MGAQLLERHRCPDRNAVAHHVQAVTVDVDDPVAGGVGDVGLVQVPLVVDHPVEGPGAGGDRASFELDDLAQKIQRRSDAVPG